jgi:phosphoribosyl 1,2-cyclic phosphodiesterase
MGVRFTALASGSSGNAAVLMADGFGVLIDFGLGPRMLAARLAAVGLNWKHVNAAVLTHTHGDHWKNLTFGTLKQHRIPVYCHPRHEAELGRYSAGFHAYKASGLLRPFEEDQSLDLAPGVRCRPLRVSHDSDPTYAFRIDGGAAGFQNAWSVGYASDLGTWTDRLVKAFAGVDLLAVEFNHDEVLERRSRRPAHLIERVLGDHGHLSNRQAGALVQEVVRSSADKDIGHVVQLHLSRDCNRPVLAADAAAMALADVGSRARVTTAQQDHPTRLLDLYRLPKATPPVTRREKPRFRPPAKQPTLPGMEL